MNALSFIDSPPKQTPLGVAVIYGDEGFLRVHSLDLLRRLVLGDGDDFGQTRLSGPAAELAEVLDELNTPPLFGARRLVIVEDADDFVSRYRKPLEEYAKADAKKP